MSSFGEVLQQFKELEEAENIAAIVDDRSLQNGIIAWKSVGIRYKSASECTELDPTSRWKWLWSQVEFDSTDFGVVAGLKQQDVGRTLTRLIGLRLIFPDGSVSRYASQYLQSIILQKINSRGRQKKADQKQS